MLEVKDLSAHYGRTRALNGVSFAVEEHSIIALIGANGAGKSTALKIISGLHSASGGSIRFRGQRIDGFPPHKVTKLGIVYVPEGRRLFLKMTVKDNLIMGRYLARNGQKAAEAFERVFVHFPVLKERLNQKAATLSGGEQQMVAIGRALMGEPELMMLDEPSLGLSPLMTREIGKVVMDINREGTAVILSEQNARLALKLSTKAYVFETGRLALHGDTADLCQDPRIINAYLSA